MTKPLSICIYCGSRSGVSPFYAQAAQAVGAWIGQQGARLVYGGGHAGLMGTVADATLASGGTVFGVIPRALETRELAHSGITELHVVETMHQRKALMAQESDVFLALPGGIGTLEELFEVWTWLQLGYHDKPVGLLNADGYFDDLLRFMDHTTSQGFVSGEQRALLQVDDDADRLLTRLAASARTSLGTGSYGQI
ncbi:MAG: TIGR00730 family Rossman fold protein [Rhizobacter sp.]